MTYKKKIAKTIEGREFVYNKSSQMFVSEASASDICKALNGAKWQLKDGEKWFVYDVEYGDDWDILKVIKRRNGRIFITEI